MPHDHETITHAPAASRMDLFRAAMAGPAGTPYHDGLFFFDIKLPSGYPATPPQAHTPVI